MQYYLLFVLGAVFSWGMYGPALHKGQLAFDDPERINKSLKALLCVGAAYFLVGVLVPAGILSAKGQLGGFSAKATTFSTFAGVLGALGAVCIIWAFKNGGSPLIVMPLVFAGAPVVNAIVSTMSHPPKDGLGSIHPMLYVGLAMVATGAYFVLRFKPV